jgi:hypothetical protein
MWQKESRSSGQRAGGGPAGRVGVAGPTRERFVGRPSSAERGEKGGVHPIAGFNPCLGQASRLDLIRACPHLNRLKAIKRAMFGRARFDPPRTHVLAAD